MAGFTSGTGRQIPTGRPGSGIPCWPENVARLEPHLLLAYGWIVLVLILVTEIGLLQRIFDTVALNPQQWVTCLLAALGFLVFGEILTLVWRLASKTPSTSNGE